jgi:hypothetical protein
MGVQDEMNGQDQNLKMNVQFPNFNFKKKVSKCAYESITVSHLLHSQIIMEWVG